MVQRANIILKSGRRYDNVTFVYGAVEQAYLVNKHGENVVNGTDKNDYLIPSSSVEVIELLY